MKIQDELLRSVPELAHYVRRPSYFAANGFYWATAAVFAVVQTALMPLYWLLSAVWDIAPAGFVTAAQLFMYIGVMLLPLWGYILSRPEERAAFRLSRPKIAHAALALPCAAVGFLAANFTTTLWLLLLEQLGWNAPVTDAFTGSIMLDVVMIALLPGICEELLFRGMILGAYERRGTWRAIWISALLFAGLHGSVAGFPAQLMLGLALGYAAASANSVAVPMLLHAAYNLITVLFSYASPAETDAGLTMLSQIGGLPGAAVCAVMAAVSVTAFLWSLRLLDRVRIRADEPFGSDAVIEPAPMSRAELVLLLSGIVTVVWFYVRNLLGI